MEDGEAERVRSRLMLTHVPTDMIACLHETLEEHNPCTRFYRARDAPGNARREAGSSATENAARSPEVSIVFNDDYPSYHRDLVVHGRAGSGDKVQHVNPVSDHLDALLYPLLFPGGLAWWHAQLGVPTERRPKCKAIDSSLLHHA